MASSGIVAPWNYPFSLALMPLATALAAGNRAMIKPSELTPATSDLLVSLIADTFSDDEVAVVTGGAAVGAAFAALPFDHLFFTGSTAVGRAVMRTASEPLVPVTLELGGKSPVVVDRGQPLARRGRPVRGVTASELFAEAGRHAPSWDYLRWTGALRGRALLIVTADDQNRTDMDALATALRNNGSAALHYAAVETDHSFSDRRIA